MINDSNFLYFIISVVSIFFFYIGFIGGRSEAMIEAYELNLAKECIGKSGYYFTCDEKGE